MEPCWYANKSPKRRTLLSRPFPVRPFLSTYDTDELAHFMKRHLDSPFNHRFAKFIEIVKMTGADFVRLSKKDLARLCDGEGPYLYDLVTFQESLRRPSSPDVRNVFSLPKEPASPRSEAKIPPSELEDRALNIEFDLRDDNQIVDDHFAGVPALSLITSSEALSANKGHHEGNTGDVLIDMFSPLPPSSAFDSDDSLSEHVPDVFDSPPPSSLASPCFSDEELEEDTDILGLGLSTEQPESPPSPTPPGEHQIAGLGLEHVSELGDVDLRSPVLAGDEFKSPAGLQLKSSSQTAAAAPVGASVAENLWLEKDLSIAGSPTEETYDPGPSLPRAEYDVITLIPGSDAPEHGDTEPEAVARPLASYAREEDPDHPVDPLHPASSSKARNVDHRVDPSSSPASHGPAIADDDLDDEGQGEGGGLSAFMSDLRSLDSFPPSPAYDADDSPSYNPAAVSVPARNVYPTSYERTPSLSLSDVFSDGTSSGFSGGSLGLTVSPELTIIQTPMTVHLHDDVLIASPAMSYHHLSSRYGSAMHPDASQQELTYERHRLATVWGKGQEVVHEERPRLEVLIPTLPSLLDDTHLSSLMSTVELAKARIGGGQASRTVSSASSSGSSSSSRPPASALYPERNPRRQHHHPPSSPRRMRKYSRYHILSTSTSASEPTPAHPHALHAVSRSKSTGTVPEQPSEATGVFWEHQRTNSQEDEKQAHKQMVTAASTTATVPPWCEKGEYILSILTPVEGQGEGSAPIKGDRDERVLSAGRREGVVV